MEVLKAYGKMRGKQQLLVMVLLVFVNLYFYFFIQEGKKLGHLLYLDFLFVLPMSVFLALDYLRFRKRAKKLKALLAEECLISRDFPEFGPQEIACHDVQVLEGQIEKQFEESCALQDYVAKWCHEMKIPLAAGLLMGESRIFAYGGRGRKRRFCCLWRTAEREYEEKISGGFLRKALPGRTATMGNISLPGWGFTWRKKLSAGWDMASRWKANTGCIPGFA